MSEFCPHDGNACFVGGDPDNAHWRCGTTQCGSQTMHEPDLIERCSHAAREFAPVTRLMSLAVTRAVLVEFLAAIRKPWMIERLAAQVDWANDERVRAGEREMAERVLDALSREVDQLVRHS